MKRFSMLLLVAILSLNTLGFTAQNAPAISTSRTHPISNPFTVGLPMPGQHIVCKTIGTAKICASVSAKLPTRYSYVTVYGTLKINGVAQKNKTMKTVWNYKTTSSSCSGTTNINGLAQCKRYIAGASTGYTVNVDVTIGTYTVSTSFTPQ